MLHVLAEQIEVANILYRCCSNRFTACHECVRKTRQYTHMLFFTMTSKLTLVKVVFHFTKRKSRSDNSLCGLTLSHSCVTDPNVIAYMGLTLWGCAWRSTVSCSMQILTVGLFMVHLKDHSCVSDYTASSACVSRE